MKRATLLLDDSLYDRAKKLCAERNQTLKDIINELIRAGLSTLTPRPKHEAVRIPLHKNTGTRPGVDISDRDSLYDIMDEKP